MNFKIKSRVEVPELIERRRSQIIKAAIELFGKRGYHVTTIRDIAKRADVSIGLIYQYVSDKEDVLFLVLIEVLESYKRGIPAALKGIEEPLDRFCAAVRAYCTVNDEKVEATVLAYRETKSLRKERRNIIKQKEIETNRLIAACIQDCIRAGLFEKVDVELFTYQIVMFSHAWALKAWHFRGRMSLDQYVWRGLTLMLGPVLTARGARVFKALKS
ncbi:MAG: TetR/AcrR family transcriptional regulator [Rhizobiales bacterium]|nr:TetR/AcrR family transcriptional regulator [Hyphomicrobiales bacterium]